MSDPDARIIAEFRAHAGRVAGAFKDIPLLLLLLHTISVTSGAQRVHPTTYHVVGDSYAVFAAKGATGTHPDWYHDLLANPEASIEVRTRTIEVTARILDAEHRESIRLGQEARYPGLAGHESGQPRPVLTVVMLDHR